MDNFDCTEIMLSHGRMNNAIIQFFTLEKLYNVARTSYHIFTDKVNLQYGAISTTLVCDL